MNEETSEVNHTGEFSHPALTRAPSPGTAVIHSQLSAIAGDAERAVALIDRDAVAALERARHERDIATTRMAEATTALDNAIGARACRTIGPAMKEQLRTADPAKCVGCGDPLPRRPRPASGKSKKPPTRSRPRRDDLLDDDRSGLRASVCSPACAEQLIDEYDEQVRAATLRELRCEEAWMAAGRDLDAAHRAVEEAETRVKLLAALRPPVA